MSNKKGQLFIIPSTLGSDHALPFLAPTVIDAILSLDHFIVENLRSARRFLKKCGYSKNFDDVIFFELNNRTKPAEWAEMIGPLKSGIDMGLLSDAGVPAVADPGSEIVSLAHSHQIRIKPLVGPSSILLALMASGLNGQGFTFNGYLPRKENERIKALKQLEFLSKKTGFTQIFMDTPYRNIALLENIVENLSPYTQLCIAVNLTMPDEKIVTQDLIKWKKSNISLDKKPAMFLLLA